MTIDDPQKKTVIVVGLGMVGLSFVEKLLEYDSAKSYKIEVFGEEPIVAYNRVGLTQYFAHRDVTRLLLQTPEWYADNNVTIHLGQQVTYINHVEKWVESSSYPSRHFAYDYCVLATGSSAALPPSLPGLDSKGVFVYRTIDDLEAMIHYAKSVKTATVVGGGLLGLEAAKAMLDLGANVTIFERNPRLMSRQLDHDAGLVLSTEIEKLNIKITLSNAPVEILPDENNAVAALKLEDGSIVTEQMVVFAIGIRPRDQLARLSAIDVHPRGGVQVNDFMETSAENVYAIGEVALHRGTIYGLVAPGYDMAEVVARNLASHRDVSDPKRKKFSGGDLSSKLKLLGVHVASFGNYFAGPDISLPLVYKDPFGGIYKKYVFSKDGKHLLGGMMVGDTSDYGKLHALTKSKRPLPTAPGELILGVKNGTVEGADALPDEAQICSCNNVTKGTVRRLIREKKLTSVGETKACSKAGTGCGGCIPQVTEIFEAELKSMGVIVKNYVCHHFEYSRTELFEISKVKKLKSFAEIMAFAGKKADAIGCEVCKPAVASILASLYNNHILDHTPLQDTNDRFLANIQRGGTYSVVPRIPAGEITPSKLVAIGEIAKEYGLYTKITGGQRIDMFGARKQDLPDIWEKLVNQGFETGQAYGKSIRTVKSCVGSTWCRYGIGDSVGFAVKIENRYKGLRSPHKLKGGVSGCVRECAEAQSKDFGLIATDKGYNLYVCGNGGAKPKHAVLLASDVPEELCIRYLDRFLMYYISTADKLTRTARWLEKMEGGIDHLRRVVIDDHLKIAAELETQMEYLVSTYQCEWATVVNDPERRSKFRQFVNSKEAQEEIEFIPERGQKRPANWPKDTLPSTLSSSLSLDDRTWVPIGPANIFSKDSGETFKYGECQLAIFHTSTDKWYASQNMCPHKRAFVLAQGLLGDSGDGTPYVSCGMHKKNFSLSNGKCLVPGEEEKYSLMTFEVKVDDNGLVHALLPSEEALGSVLSTKKLMITSGSVTNGKSIKLGVVNGHEDDGVEIVSSNCVSSGCGDKKLDW